MDRVEELELALEYTRRERDANFRETCIVRGHLGGVIQILEVAEKCGVQETVKHLIGVAIERAKEARR